MSSSKRSTGGARARAGPEVGQSTISFASRVTKPVTRDATKKAALSDAPAPRKTTVEVTPPSKDEAEETPVEDVSLEEVEPVEEEEVTPDEEKSEAELRAEQVSDREIAGYWAKLESERIAPRVHQEGVTLSEKVLRYFDVSSQYGPSVGISRTKRWMRAEVLGLSPPIEVLAVLMREREKKTDGIETAYVEVLLNHTAAA